jgi:hypothetical protein
VYILFVIISNLGIGDYKHEMNSEFVSISGINSFAAGLIICTIFLIYKFILYRKLIEDINIDDISNKVEIIYMHYFINKKQHYIPFDDLKYNYKLRLGFKYFDFVLEIKDSNETSFKIRTSKYGWSNELVTALKDDLKKRKKNKRHITGVTVAQLIFSNKPADDTLTWI